MGEVTIGEPRPDQLHFVEGHVGVVRVGADGVKQGWELLRRLVAPGAQLRSEVAALDHGLLSDQGEAPHQGRGCHLNARTTARAVRIAPAAAKTALTSTVSCFMIRYVGRARNTWLSSSALVGA